MLNLGGKTGPSCSDMLVKLEGWVGDTYLEIVTDEGCKEGSGKYGAFLEISGVQVEEAWYSSMEVQATLFV